MKNNVENNNEYNNFNETDIKNKLEEILNQGTSTPHYWFYKLDYLLWETKEQYFEEFFDNDKNDLSNKQIKQKIIEDFRLKRLNSIEHIYPRSKNNEFKSENCQIDNFGNLALISNHMNSAFLDKDYQNKKLKLQEQINNGTIESLKLILVYLKYNEWNAENCKKHHDEMIILLKNDLIEKK